MAALLLAFLAAPAAASVALYGQCGGIGYTGSTECAAGSVCEASNDYYHQCVAGAAAPTATSASVPSKGTSSRRSCSGSSDAEKYLITFGDSYSQTGFDISGAKPNAANPLGNPELPGWTASGGLNWVGFLASEFSASTILTYNFADGGATTDANLVTPFQPTVRSFIDQVGLFSDSIASHPEYAPWTSENTLVGVWMGVNDVGNSYWEAGLDALDNKIMDRYFEQLQILYDAGARNFALLTVPPITKTPSVLAQSADVRKTEDAAIAKYNGLIATRLAAFEQANSGVEATIIDTAAPFNTAINNPTAYGAPNAVCYNEDGTSCLWFNDYHPGVAINKLVAQAVADAWHGTFF